MLFSQFVFFSLFSLCYPIRNFCQYNMHAEALPVKAYLEIGDQSPLTQRSQNVPHTFCSVENKQMATIF